MDWITSIMGLSAASLIFLVSKWLEQKQMKKFAAKGGETNEEIEED